MNVWPALGDAVKERIVIDVKATVKIAEKRAQTAARADDVLSGLGIRVNTKN